MLLSMFKYNFFIVTACLFINILLLTSNIVNRPIFACNDMDIVNIVKNYRPDNIIKADKIHILTTNEAEPITAIISDRLTQDDILIQIESLPADKILKRLKSKTLPIPDIFFFYDRRFSQRKGLCPKFYPFFIELALDSVCLLFSKKLDQDASIEASRLTGKDWPTLLNEKIFKFGKMDKEFSPLGIRTENMAKMAAIKYKKLAGSPEKFLKKWHLAFNEHNIFKNFNKMISALEKDEIDLCFSYYASGIADGYKPVELASDINQSKFLSWQKSSMAGVVVNGQKVIAQAVTFCMAVGSPKKKSSSKYKFLMDFFKQASSIFDSIGLRTAHIIEETKYLLYQDAKKNSRL